MYSLHTSIEYVVVTYFYGNLFLWFQAPPKSVGNIDLAPGTEIIIEVRIYVPYSCFKEIRIGTNELKCSHEIVLLASQTIAELRDKIACVNDELVCAELHNLEDEKRIRSRKPKEEYPSGFIFIEGTFYNDFRHPNAIDYSEVIVKWGNEKNIGKFKTADMATTKLEDLKLRLGYPYVYQHMGDCEHIVVFSDARLLTKNDSMVRKDYPYIKGVHRITQRNCGLCDSEIGKWVVMDSERVVHDCTYFCDACFKAYNFVDGKKIGEFKAYPYYDRSALI